ncbi:hypothetical protein BB558_000096 [Smittium angustum]|uniref:PDZ domain-containing protein n=1 Tax=Smittium angustum TaxID=133377 RepID=A0A2U1JF56_SMIAN|nr:hypothetical protein BB558_000096 [Smittium angustum]
MDFTTKITETQESSFVPQTALAADSLAEGVNDLSIQSETLVDPKSVTLELGELEAIFLQGSDPSILPPPSFKTTDSIQPLPKNLELELDSNDLILETAGVSPPESWKSTLQKAINAIVSIKSRCVKSFDTEVAGHYGATGFVVDAQNGIILSNRHVVNPAPTVATALFQNYEEVELMPIYIDPIHDFGFFKFDPKKVSFMELTQISLVPQKAKVGLDIKVVGNDSGEKISILSGTLARLDRECPDYGINNYNDYNTFYYQAASGTSGGSSGSPVLDIYGDAVALNCGGSNISKSSFYLPLDRVVRALNLIRENKPVSRGTLQTVFVHSPYDKLRRLGLPHEAEKLIRTKFPKETGMLTITHVMPEGPADKLLHVGDILIAINETPLAHFLELSKILDDNLGNEITLKVIRSNKYYSITCKVQNLYEITPSKYVEVGESVVNELSYQIAIHYGLPARGVYVASYGYMLLSAGVSRDNVITSINHKKTNNLEEFIEAICSLTIGTKVPIKHFELGKQNKEILSIMNVVPYWFNFHFAERNPQSGLWDIKKLTMPKLDSNSFVPKTITGSRFNANMSPANEIWPSTVSIHCDVPFLLEGTYSRRFFGPGYIIDKENGIVVCDRNTVLLAASDVYVTFYQSLTIPARVILLHPVYNVSFLKYDPKLVGDTILKDLEYKKEYYSGEKKLEPGDSVVLVAFGQDLYPIVRRTRVSTRRLTKIGCCNPPRWRTVNTEGIMIEDQPYNIGGLLCDEEGLVCAFWLNYSAEDQNGNDYEFMSGLDISMLRPVIESLREGKSVNMRSLDIDISKVEPYTARLLGLSEDRMRQLMQASENSHVRLLSVNNLLSITSEASKLLKPGDVIVEKDGVPVTEVDQLVQIYDESVVNLVVLRDGGEVELKVPTTVLSNLETDHFLQWAGAILQKPYRAIEEQISSSLPSEIYIVCTFHGSPSNSMSMTPKSFITEVEGTKVYHLEDFVNVIKSVSKSGEEGRKTIRDGYLRITTVDYLGVPKVLSIKLDDHYWPSIQYIKDENCAVGWRIEFGIENFS